MFGAVPRAPVRLCCLDANTNANATWFLSELSVEDASGDAAPD